MTTESLSAEQQAFLEECTLEFSDRYSDADSEYKKVYDAGIPPPPIMCPWYGRPKLTANRYRDRAGGSRYKDWGPRHQEHNFRDRDRASDDSFGSGGSFRQHERRYRPY